MVLAVWLLLLSQIGGAFADTSSYSPRGVGGGGAMAAYSISPYSDLRFVGTDMGTLFRSTDGGKSWRPVRQDQAAFGSDLSVASPVGFSSDSHLLFYAESGKNPKRSVDSGLDWESIPVPLRAQERILYWVSDARNPSAIFCATTEGLLRSSDRGRSWSRSAGLQGPARGTLLAFRSNGSALFHATEAGIFLSEDGGRSFKPWYNPQGFKIRAFAGGNDARGVTLAFIDDRGDQACSWARHAPDSNEEQIQATIADCGFVWVKRGAPGDFSPDFVRTSKDGGRFLRMAENDSKTLYLTGGDWVRQYGSKVWVSRDAGKSWDLRLQIYDWDKHPYRPWPRDKLEYSAVGLDVGWDDGLYSSFAVNARNSSEAGGTGYYFLHTTSDYGAHWKAPFTQFADTGERTRGKKWKSTGLEVTSVLRLKFHPKQPKLGYAALSDLGGYVTEDGGESWRISKVKFNTNYDYAFDPDKIDLVYAASGNQHDYPLNFNSALHGAGGIFVSNDRGRSWKRLTPETQEWDRQFISVAYDPIRRVIYGGTQGGGVGVSKNGGRTWEFLNSGFPTGDLIIPQIETDPRDGTAYALVSGNPPDFGNSEETGIYRLESVGNGGHWVLLRGHVQRPGGVDPKIALWRFPTSFDVDFSKPNRNSLWLADMETQGAWLATGAWKSSDGGKTWERKTQFTHPTSLLIDPSNSWRTYVSGLYDVTGKWGVGGALSTSDGGESWEKNEDLPLSANLFGFVPDPSRPENGFYLFFGGGMLYGPSHGNPGVQLVALPQ